MGFEFTLALSEADKLDCFRIRHTVFALERKWIAPNNDGLETDEWDEHSISLIARDQTGKAVGTARMILDNPLGFPYEKVEALPFGTDRTLMFEVSRLAVLPESRKCSSTITIGLCRAIWQYANILRLQQWVAVIDRPVVRLLSRIRFEFKYKGVPVCYLGSESIPLLCEMQASQRALFSLRLNTQLLEHCEPFSAV